MDKRTLRVLEYEKIIQQLASHARSELGKSLIMELEPFIQYGEVEKKLDETDQAEAIIAYIGSSPMDSFPDITTVLKKAAVGSVLSPKELLQIAQVLKVVLRIKDEINNYPYKDKIPLIIEQTAQLNPHKHLMEEILRCIETEEYISDYASPQLASIRRSIQRTHDKIRDRLNSLIHSPHFQKYLQEPIITIRNDRYVVPVKQEHRSNVPGMIHDQSSSGATLFIEPMPVVEANNELRELFLKEQREIEKILADLTNKVQAVNEDIRVNMEILVYLDTIFAKGSYSRSYRGVRPKIVNQKSIKIINGRHPLIKDEEVVPITIKLGEDFTTLVITGPNTGGKTVTLKTAGLFVLMTQSGLHLPADMGTEMGIFEEVFADIGDEQSIEQSLSTFSSHMTNIVKIIERCTQNSLLLFDELGAGTDPTEGAALAMAILDFLNERKILTIATTHYSELKAYALTKPGMENASMEFDVDTLRPTYRLLIGVPGKSNAFEISKRLGLSDELIERAREFLSQEDIRFEDLLTDMERNRIRAREEREEATRELDKVKRIRLELEEKQHKLYEREKRILLQAQEEAKRILQQAKDEADNIIKEMQKRLSMIEDREHRRAMEDAREKLRNKLNDMEEALKDSQKPSIGLIKPPKDLKPGETVYITNLDQTGQVLNVMEQSDEVQVQVGIMKINVHISNLRRTEEKKEAISGKRVPSNRNIAVSMELDVRGRNVEEALIEIDKYLDDVFLAGIKEVTIIHGKGTGMLRNGIHKHLRHHPHVESFRLGKFGEGESGVTIIKIK